MASKKTAQPAQPIDQPIVIHLSVSGATPEPTMVAINLSELFEQKFGEFDLSTVSGVHGLAAASQLVDPTASIANRLSDAFKVPVQELDVDTIDVDLVKRLARDSALMFLHHLANKLKS